MYFIETFDENFPSGLDKICEIPRARNFNNFVQSRGKNVIKCFCLWSVDILLGMVLPNKMNELSEVLQRRGGGHLQFKSFHTCQSNQIYNKNYQKWYVYDLCNFQVLPLLTIANFDNLDSFVTFDNFETFNSNVDK